MEVTADQCIADCDFSDANMLILPGGATHLDECQPLCDLLRKHNEQGKQIAAICAAPSVLGKLGILEGKQATCYPGFEDFLGEKSIREEYLIVSGGSLARAASEWRIAVMLPPGKSVRPHEPANSVSPESSSPPERIHTLPGVCPGVSNT